MQIAIRNDDSFLELRHSCANPVTPPPPLIQDFSWLGKLVLHAQVVTGAQACEITLSVCNHPLKSIVKPLFPYWLPSHSSFKWISHQGAGKVASYLPRTNIITFWDRGTEELHKNLLLAPFLFLLGPARAPPTSHMLHIANNVCPPCRGQGVNDFFETGKI